MSSKPCFDSVVMVYTKTNVEIINCLGAANVSLPINL